MRGIYYLQNGNIMKKIALLVLVMLGFAQVSAVEVDCSKMSTNELNKALVRAVEKGCFDQVQKLVRAGADVNGEITIFKSQGRGEGCMDYIIVYTLLEYAANNGYIDIVKELIEAGAVIYADHGQFESCGSAALIAAAGEGHVDVVKELIQAGADVNHPDRGYTALIAASMGGHVNIVRELIKMDADVNYAGEGYSALSAASRAGHVDVVRELIQAGADVNYAGHGETALIEASMRGHIDVIRELIQAGAFVNIPDTWGNTALMYAIKNHNFDVVHSLLQSPEFHPGIWQFIKDLFSDSETKPINYADKDGNTALMLAIENIQYRYTEGDKREYSACVNSQRILEELFNFPGVDYHYANKNGETAIILLEELQKRQKR